MKYSARLNCGDGKFPNRYWVSESNDYLVKKEKEIINIEEHDKKFKSEGKTYPQAFKTYKEALTFLDTLYNNRLTIEDRLSGQVFEQTKIVCVCCGKEEWESFTDTKFTEKKMKENGYIFE